MPLLEAGPAGTRSAKASSVSKQGGRGFLTDLGRVWRQDGLEKTSPVAVVQAAPRVHRKCRAVALHVPHIATWSLNVHRLWKPP